MKYKSLYITLLFTFSASLISQSDEDLNKLTGGLDAEYLQSLPEDVRIDLLSEINKNKMKDDKQTLKKRPSTALNKFETIKDWEDFQRQRNIEGNISERYGINLFRTMQSSFMPINEPNFGSDYILDYGDYIEIRAFGGLNRDFYEEINRDGTITIDGIGKINLAGLNFDQAVKVLNTEFENSYIGVNIVVNLGEVRDIKVLITGNSAYPGMYTISGNSNILQALNIAGGINENGSLRDISVIRNGVEIDSIDLYEALIFGDTRKLKPLKSGDSINIKPVLNLVRAGSGFINQALFELKENETFEDLLEFSGGLSRNVQSKNFSVVRYVNSNFEKINMTREDLSSMTAKNLDTISLNIDKVGSVEVMGSVNNPGTYSISSNDRLSDVIIRAGGYTDSAYIYGGRLLREKAKQLEKDYAQSAYDNLIRFIAADTDFLLSPGAGALLPLILSEIKNIEPVGRVIAEFRLDRLEDNPVKDIYMNDKDKIFIPKYDSSVFVFGEVSSPGSVNYSDGKNVNYYLQNTGGLTKFSSTKDIYIVSPDGSTAKVSNTKRLSSFLAEEQDIYPGTVIYVPREIGQVRGIDFYATIAPIFSSLALSLASLNSIND